MRRAVTEIRSFYASPLGQTAARLIGARLSDAWGPLTGQDVLGLGTEHRMNLPGQGEGHWAWRFSWAQVQPWHAERLARLGSLYRRN